MVERPGREASKVHARSADAKNLSLYLYSLMCFLEYAMTTLLGILNVYFSYEVRQALT